jgi:hypothetical protein
MGWHECSSRFYYRIATHDHSSIYSCFSRISVHQQVVKNSVGTAFYEHHKTIQVYHTSRLKVHQVLTPLLLIIYWIGFGMLLPNLKVHISSFWFSYVWILSIPIAIGMVIFIAYHIKKERNSLKELQEELAGD